ncbi:MAG TPA: hypothetical protein VGE16_16255 [Albitalea sp.]
MPHEPFTALEQDQLDWISRFADRLRLQRREFADENRSHDANEIARSLWEQPEWRALDPHAAAERWTAQQARR